MPKPTTANPYEYIIKAIKADLNKLPPNELHYYVALLTGSIALEKESPEMKTLLVYTQDLIVKLKAFHEAVSAHELKRTKIIGPLTEQEQEELETAKKALFVALNRLITHSKMHDLPHKIKNIVFKVCSVILAIILGVTLGLFGMMFFSPKFRLDLGFAAGFIVGLHISIRAPHKAFTSAFEDRLGFCVDSIEKIAKGQMANEKSYADYAEETELFIKGTFFKTLGKEEREKAFQEFISKPHKFRVCTASASFLHSRLRGYLGQHSFIRYFVAIEGKNTPFTMEFNPGSKAPDNWEVNQFEDERQVDGPTFFKMMVMNRMLSETNAMSVKYMLNDYSVGTNDCLTYVNKILIATGQAPSQIPRFSSKVEKWQSTFFIAPLMRKLSISNGKEFEHFHDGVKRDVKPVPFKKLNGVEKEAALKKQEAISTDELTSVAPAA